MLFIQANGSVASVTAVELKPGQMAPSISVNGKTTKHAAPVDSNTSTVTSTTANGYTTKPTDSASTCIATVANTLANGKMINLMD